MVSLFTLATIVRQCFILFVDSHRMIAATCSSFRTLPSSLLLTANGWPRVIAKNGIQLLDDWPFTFTNTTMVYFTEYPDPPQGDVFRYRVGRLRVMLPDGRQRYLDIGNVSLSPHTPIHFVKCNNTVLIIIIILGPSKFLLVVVVDGITIAHHQLYRIRIVLAFQCHNV